MKLWRPVISNKVTQYFGEDKACVYPNGKITGKKNGVCPKGSISFYQSIGMISHNGIDIATWRGEPVFHCADWEGKMKIEKDYQGGIGVDVISTSPVTLDDGYKGYIKTRSWHLKAPVGYDGKLVKLGDTIGLCDNTGASSADHLHFGVKKCDKNGASLEKNNGYFGAFDFTKYMDFKTDAKTASEYLYNRSPKLSEQERKEMQHALTLAQQLLNFYLEMRRSILR